MADRHDEEQFRHNLPEDRKIWERADGETDKQYHAFRCFRDIEPSHERTLPIAAAMYYGRPLDYYVQGNHVVPPNLVSWKGEWNWLLRCRAYDFHRERERMEAVQHARIEKAREEGFELAHVEHILFDRYISLSEKIDLAIKKLPVENPVWRDINAAMKVANDIAVNFYKISKFKHDMKDDAATGLSPQDMEDFWGKTPPNQQMHEEMGEMAEES